MKDDDLENFIELRCKICNKFICEVSADSTGVVRRKCDKCKHQVKIRLPILEKANTIFSGQQALKV